MKISTMNVNEGRIVKNRTAVDQRRTKILAARTPVASDQSTRQEASFKHAIHQTQSLHHLDRIRRHLNAGSDFAKAFGPLEQPRLETALQKARGQRHAPDSSSDDSN